jgi:hypothetical protein
MAIHLKTGQYYDVCECCGEIYELKPDTDLILMKEGHDKTCVERGDHYHSKQAIPMCRGCMNKKG